MIESIIRATIGGALIGLAASSLLYFYGRIAGISGIVGRMFARKPGDLKWRAAFLIGLLGGGAVLAVFMPAVFHAPTGRSLWMVGLAGLLVGFGTRLANGCTSGHGVCGLSRLSQRSLIATLTFMATGFATATLLGVLQGSAS